MSHRNTTDFQTIPLLITHGDLLRRKSATPRYGLIVVVFFACCLLVGCGPERSGSSQDDLTTTTQTIALNYQNHRNLTQASTELADLPVANVNQWLLLITETAVAENSDPNQTNAQTNALVALVMDLGLQSNAIYAYALQHNLVAAAAAQPIVQVNVQTTPEAIAAASQADAVAVLTTPTTTSEQAVVTQNASVTTTTATTSTVSTNTVSTNTAAVANTTIITATATPVPLSPVTNPQIVASGALNVRSGPGTDYPIIAALQQGEIANITGKNTNGDWWEIGLANGQIGWVFGSLVTTAGDTSAVAVAANIPPPPATATPAPAAPPTATTVPAAPAATAVPAVDPNGTPHFTLVSRRLWSKDENDGCVGKHLLRVHVLDANGGRINGIRLKGIYTGEEFVTGDQGKGDGIIEFDLHGSGEGFTVIKNNDGRDATSDRAEGFTTRSVDIDKPTLIAAGYCTNDEDCQIFYNSWGCQGHHSWEAIFKRNY